MLFLPIFRLSAHICGYKCFQIELSRGYDYAAFHDDIKKLYDMAGVKNEHTVFLFTDTQVYTVMILNFRTDRSGQTVQTQIRLLLEEQSDQGLHCLQFHLHLFVEIPSGLASLFDF